MDKVDLEDARGFRLASILDPTSPSYTPRSKPTVTTLKADHHKQLCEILGRGMEIDTMPQTATFLKEVSRNGVCYGTSKTSTFKDSPIIFQDRNPSDRSIKAGITSHIFQYQYLTESGENVDSIFCVVDTLEPVAAHLDPYRMFTFGGFLCKPTNRQVILSLAQIKSHFALTKFDDLIHVLPVDRLMLEFEMDPVADTQGEGETAPDT